MRPIKFRGKAFNGKLIYGDLTRDNYCGYKNIYVENEPVDPESVAQLVGYDERGRKIYEGDEFTDPFNGRIFTAEIKARVQEKDGDTPSRDFFDNFYVLEPIKIDVLFSAPDLSDEDFQKMLDKLITVRGWFKKNNNQSAFEIFDVGRNITISGEVSKKSIGYLQQVLDEYGIEEVVNRGASYDQHLVKLTDLVKRFDENGNELYERVNDEF